MKGTTSESSVKTAQEKHTGESASAPEKTSGGEIVTADGFKPTEIGYLPQQTPVQKDFPASVWEVVLSGRLNRCGMYPFYRKSDKEDAEEKWKCSASPA